MLAVGAASPCWAQAAPERNQPREAAALRTYSIPAGALAPVLNRFAAEAGVILSFDATLLLGRQSGGLHGAYSVVGGFAALLEGHPLQVQRDANGYSLHRKLVVPVDSVPAQPAKVSELRTVEVSDKTIGTVSALNREMIQSLPTLNGDIGSQLKLNPAIQFSETQLSSQTSGEIAPAEISIHGAKPYQNEMMVDGVSIANDIDPGSRKAVGNEDPEFIPGGSQAIAIDAELMCNIQVRDSNVSAEYGRFTGGVVEAELCKARQPLSGRVAVAYTGSDWSRLIIDPAKQNEFENSYDADNQPHFRKWTYKAHAEVRPTQDWGVAISTVRRTSDIPLKQFSASGASTTQTRINDTVALKADWSPQGSRDSADFSLIYAPNESSYFKKNFLNSNYTLVGGGLALSARLERALESQTLSQQLSYTETAQSRRSDANYYKPWRWSSAKNWGDTTSAAVPANSVSGEGAWGDVDQVLNTWNYKLKSQHLDWALGSTTHSLVTGLDLKQQNARYQRLVDTTQYLLATNITAWSAGLTQAACAADTEACSTTPTLSATSQGQYFRSRSIYQAGSFDLDAQSFGAYLEDRMKWQNWTLRLGARADYDSIVDDTNIAPRSSISWDVRDDLQLTLGANRYYGRSLMAYAIQERVRTLKSTQTRLNTTTWGVATKSRTANRLQDVNSPYDDEISLGGIWDLQSWGQWSLGLTAREGKSQIVKRIYRLQPGCDANQCYVYTNEGGSATKDLALSWNSNERWKVAGTETSAWMAFNKSDIRSNYSTYADAYSSDQAEDVTIQYDGRFIKYSEMPADNYNRPWTLRLAAITQFPKQQLTVSNVLRIRAGYEQMLQTGTTDYNGSTVDVWTRTKLPESVTLDAVFQWTPYIRPREQLEVKLTVENLLDRANMTTTSASFATYERGRTFLLEVGYRF